VSIFNTFDTGEVFEMALRTPIGEKVLINHVRENSAAFKALLG
jgi:hypothetical protein